MLDNVSNVSNNLSEIQLVIFIPNSVAACLCGTYTILVKRNSKKTLKDYVHFSAQL